MALHTVVAKGVDFGHIGVEELCMRRKFQRVRVLPETWREVPLASGVTSRMETTRAAANLPEKGNSVGNEDAQMGLLMFRE